MLFMINFLIGISYLVGQDYTKSGAGVIEYKVAKGAPVSLEIQSYRGNLQWQQSANGTTWQNWPDETKSKLDFDASQEVYIRLSVTSENCSPIYSSTAHVVTYTSPIVETQDVMIVLVSEAQCGGTVISEGGDPVTARGICWAKSIDPTLANEHTINGNGTGTFTTLLDGLSPETPYFFRAYASNGAGTSYGLTKQFTTNQAVTLPTITTSNITSITDTTAICGGDVTNEGGTAVQLRGICWNTTGNPTISDNSTVDGAGFGEFISNLTGLTKGTTYYVRAYASKCVGTSYGEQKQFTTSGGSVN
jgi:Tfp pilus assembly protein FimT